jgi:glutaredoxin 3
MLEKSNGMRTVPQIFINDAHVGGYSELSALAASGDLSNLLIDEHKEK